MGQRIPSRARSCWRFQRELVISYRVVWFEFVRVGCGPRGRLGDTIKHSSHLASDPRATLILAERGKQHAFADVSFNRVD